MSTNGSGNAAVNRSLRQAGKIIIPLQNFSEKFRFFIFPLFIGMCLIFSGCSSAPKYDPYRPYENILTIMADCRRFLDVNIYKYPYPDDFTDQNAYKSFLVRLANYRHIHPDKFQQPVMFMQARLYERLGDYNQAAYYYRQCSQSDSSLAEKASERLNVCENFQTVCNFEIQAETPAQYIEQYLSQLEAMDILAQKCAGTDMAPVALVEKEKLQVEYALFLQKNRNLISDGTRRAVKAWEEIIEEHSESKNYPGHRMMLADFYVSMAKEYVSRRPPERIGFNWEIFRSYVFPARDVYYQISKMDGYPEKLEASGKLEAVMAWIETIRDKSK